MAEIDIEALVQHIVNEVVAQQRTPQSLSEARRPSSPNEKDTVRRVAIGSDHGGFDAKEALKTYLRTLGYQMHDVGTHSKESVDYPDFALEVARKVAAGACERGIMIDGAGIGSSMVCNKVRGIRAALCYDIQTVINSREHNNANVLTLGGPRHNSADLCEMARVWLETRFAGGRHWARINKMMAVERRKHHE